MLGFGLWVGGLEVGVWGLWFGVWGLGFGFGVWGLGFGVWGLGFGVGVWGSGIRHPLGMLAGNENCHTLLVLQQHL